MTYLVTTITRSDDRISTTTVGSYADKETAMRTAKRSARTRSDCRKYGPSSIAYVGREVTAVVAW